MESTSAQNLAKAHREHSRIFRDFRYVYPVISRRAGGLSLGINLNPDKSCNFDCIYCQIDRTRPGQAAPIENKVLQEELENFTALYQQNQLDDVDIFAEIPREKRIWKDISLSGDGEPTMSPDFFQVCELLRDLSRSLEFPLKLITISNATLFHQKSVQKGLDTLCEHNGEVWAKLDAVTAENYDLINRSRVPLQKIRENLLLAIKRWPLRIQTFISAQTRSDFEGEKLKELQSFLLQLQEENPKNLREIQLYSLARTPAESWCEGVSTEFLKETAQKIRNNTELNVGYY